MTDSIIPTGRAPSSAVIYPTWTPAAKDAVGTSMGPSRIWFTCAQGIVTEVYYPRIDIPQLKDLGFIVADENGFWIEIRRLNHYSIRWEEGVIPAITIIHKHARFTLTLKICTDPNRDVLLIQFALNGDNGLNLYMLAAPRLGEDAYHSNGWATQWEGRPVLWAEQGPYGIAISACNEQGEIVLGRRSVGMIGESDLWQDFSKNKAMTWSYAQAGPGDISLGAQLISTIGTIAVGLGTSKETAATLALGALTEGFTTIWNSYCARWRVWHKTLPETFTSHDPELPCHILLRQSAAVIKIHLDKTIPGALVASLSIPWGDASQSRAGYHLVWSRDLVETAGALVALGALDEAREVLIYLIATQQTDGHWLQNQWLGGKPFWQGIQLDETGFPVLLAALLDDQNALNSIYIQDMIRRALTFIVQNGPITGQDRWEEDSGINLFTLSIAIAALVEGSRFLTGHEQACALLIADDWNSQLEDWTFVRATDLAKRLGVDGYYVRIAPAGVLVDPGAINEPILVKNRVHLVSPLANEQVATDFLQLCRFGLRSPTDPCVIATIRVIDQLLKTDTPNGPVWHRYNNDGYGEHPNGDPFDGWGRGRGWPLLTGERGHYALLAGEDISPYIDAMTAMTGVGGMLPEQVWDNAPITEHDLFPGQPSGSAMPLVWAHGEFIKLMLSKEKGAPVDRPTATWQRYKGKRPCPSFRIWRFCHRITTVETGKDLYFLVNTETVLHWGHDSWQDTQDVPSECWGLAHVIKLKAQDLFRYKKIDFTFFWPEQSRWEGSDFHITIKQIKESL